MRDSAARTTIPGDMPDTSFDWRRIVRLVQVSRALDDIEETVLAPQGKIIYQFSARGHDVAQVILGSCLRAAKDGVFGYYRSRPLLLSMDIDFEDILGSMMGRAGGYSDGRDIGAVFNHPNPGGVSALPMCGGVGAQYTPAAGWAQAVEYRRTVLKDPNYEDAISVVLGGDGSVAANGFWSALTIATTQSLPVLFYIEDNGYGISVPSSFQTPGANIAANLASFENLHLLDGDGAEPAQAADLIKQALAHVRARRGPCLLRLRVPRLQGHSFQDTQAYKSADFVRSEQARDPLPRLKDHLVPALMTQEEWDALAAGARQAVDAARVAAEQRPPPRSEHLARFVFSETEAGGPVLQRQGGQWPEGYRPPLAGAAKPADGRRINMVAAIRQVLDHELSVNPRMVLFGEDVGLKGGVHAVTLGLQEKHGAARVFDTSLSEEGIVGRAVGMSLAGLVPVPEIQFRKYADTAMEQINDCGTMRWRTNNRFAAPMVLRMPIGFSKSGDPWHSQTNEVEFVHSPGWQVAVPSNAADAAGLLRTALRGNDPVIFLEHRNLLDAASARRPYPGDDHMLGFGQARVVVSGDVVTVVTWGAMVERCEAAAEGATVSVEVIDLRTLSPWDQEAVLKSVRRTRRCLIVHEDSRTGGFGAEIAAVIADRAFLDLDAPVSRLTMPDIPSPYSPVLLDAAVPSVDRIRDQIRALAEF